MAAATEHRLRWCADLGLKEVFADRPADGYRDVLAALHLAGIRNVPPRPDVGWKFHCVLVLHSAHLSSPAPKDQQQHAGGKMPVYETAPMYLTEQPAFLNMAVRGETELQADALLTALKRLETALGRGTDVARQLCA